jgi:hypothetical protein
VHAACHASWLTEREKEARRLLGIDP